MKMFNDDSLSESAEDEAIRNLEKEDFDKMIQGVDEPVSGLENSKIERPYGYELVNVDALKMMMTYYFMSVLVSIEHNEWYGHPKKDFLSEKARDCYSPATGINFENVKTLLDILNMEFGNIQNPEEVLSGKLSNKEFFKVFLNTLFLLSNMIEAIVRNLDREEISLSRLAELEESDDSVKVFFADHPHSFVRQRLGFDNPRD